MLTLFRILLALISAVSPRLGGKVAFRLFCTPIEAIKKSAKHQATLREAQKRFKPAIHHQLAYSGGHIAAYEFNADKSGSGNKTVYVIHGWQSSSHLMSGFAGPLVSEGWRVVFVDLPGHGNSSGRLFHLPLAVAAIHAVSKQLGQADMMIAHSLGGSVAATVIAGSLPAYPPISVDRLVLISSPCSVTRIFSEFAKQLRLSAKSEAHMHSIVRKLSGLQTDDFDVGQQLKSVATDLLVIHAPEDKEISFSEAEEIIRCNSNAQLQPAAGLGHRRIIAAEPIIQTAAAFLKDDKSLSEMGKSVA